MATNLSLQSAKEQHPANPARSWQVVATELAKEHDSKKMIVLSQELDQALDHQESNQNCQTEG